MLAIFKLIFGIFIAVVISFPNLFFKVTPGQITTTKNHINHLDTVSLKAFQILDTKCNICHMKRNRKRIFTTENMNGWSDDVYRQVFVKKRMPKGNKIRLEAAEYSLLFAWIKTVKTI
ncbi:MAG: hypothetical protein AAFQ94_15585 [Bacteroidota bacterium]